MTLFGKSSFIKEEPDSKRKCFSSKDKDKIEAKREDWMVSNYNRWMNKPIKSKQDNRGERSFECF